MRRVVERDTYISADPKTTKALTYDMLRNIRESIDEMNEAYSAHLGSCDSRFKVLENRRKKDTAIASGSGVIGGFIAVATTWIKNFFT